MQSPLQTNSLDRFEYLGICFPSFLITQNIGVKHTHIIGGETDTHNFDFLKQFSSNFTKI